MSPTPEQHKQVEEELARKPDIAISALVAGAQRRRLTGTATASAQGVKTRQSQVTQADYDKLNITRGKTTP